MVAREILEMPSTVVVPRNTPPKLRVSSFGRHLVDDALEKLRLAQDIVLAFPDIEQVKLGVGEIVFQSRAANSLVTELTFPRNGLYDRPGELYVALWYNFRGVCIFSKPHRFCIATRKRVRPNWARELTQAKIAPETIRRVGAAIRDLQRRWRSPPPNISPFED